MRELTLAVKGMLEGAFPYVWVRGQVGNLSRPGSGHIYFNLRDEEALLAAVWFKGSQKEEQSFDPLTGEVYEDGPRPGPARTLAEGQEVVCAGRLGVYAPRGAYQLVVDLVQEAGEGRLKLEFELLKARLAAKGYFDASRKRPLPANPLRVALVSSPRGAAVHDFIRIGSERGFGAQVRLHPVPVQGDEAPPAIAAAIAGANADGWAEVIALIRGGGSLEDLAAFNSERVAEAIFSSGLPVLAGIGHEVDVSLADMTADVRAATPSHAAQLLWPERRELLQRADEMDMALSRAFEALFRACGQNLFQLERNLGLLSPTAILGNWAERLREAEQRLTLAQTHCLAGLGGRLEALEAVLRKPPVCLPAGTERLERLGSGLDSAMERLLAEMEQNCGHLNGLLAALNPLQPLERGYALARRADGSFLRSKSEAAPGDLLDIQLKDGLVPVQVR